MNSIKRNQRLFYHRLATALFLILAVLAEYLASASDKINNNTQTEARNGLSGPFHMSWPDIASNTRYDFVFNINGTAIQSLFKLESDPENYLTNSLVKCTEEKQQQHHAACMFRNGTYLESFHIDASRKHESVFYSTNNKTDHTINPEETLPSTCDTGTKLKISHYCSTHWNPPLHLARHGCLHLIEWHSPLTCHSNATNQEHPCYIYEHTGKLVDLTHWILSNGSSYQVDVKGTKVKKLNLNICNEAHEPCGPNVAACLVDERGNIVESGFNNLTSMRYNAEERAVLLTSLGSFKGECEGSRIKTVIRFICKDKIIPVTGPRLVRSSNCEYIVEWPSIHACPISEVRLPATECRIKYDPLGIDIDILDLTSNQTLVEIPNIKIDGKEKKMLLGVCRGIPKNVKCEGKENSITMACLMDANNNSTTANNSMVVGSVKKSSIRLSDQRVYLESHAVNRTCSKPAHGDFNVVQQLGTRVEFFCSPTAMKEPAFLSYDDCTYIFEWGSPLLCLESFGEVAWEQTEGKSSIANNHTKSQDAAKSDSHKVETPSQNQGESTHRHQQRPPVHMDANADTEPTKMNGTDKFFMISLIVISFTAFIIVIFVLDKKTRLRITLRQARQAFQPNQQPYSRFVNDLDL